MTSLESRIEEGLLTIDYDEFLEEFKSILNRFDENSSYDGYMFETYGEELEHVRAIAQKDINRVWTIIDDGENSTITNGFHFVNRLGYMVTEAPCLDNCFTLVLD